MTIESDHSDDDAATVPPVSEREALEELDRLLANSDFQASERNKTFLRFVCTSLFDGNGPRIKAYSIAVDVFGRSPNFDPSVDPIVRIEATRLRAALSHYYELNGGRSAVRICLPRGRYIPTFIRQQRHEDLDLAPAHLQAEKKIDVARGEAAALAIGVRPVSNRAFVFAMGAFAGLGLSTFFGLGVYAGHLWSGSMQLSCFGG